MSIKRIHSRCPVRIDLAGGTVDIWPIYLLLRNPITINLAIDLYAETEITYSSGSGLTLISNDQNVKQKFQWNELNQESKTLPQLDLHLRMMRYYMQDLISDKQRSWLHQQEVTLKTQARSPAGAGLGGSSALSISIIGAIDQMFSLKSDSNTLIERVRDLEAQVIAVPTGLQDYFGAMYGGLQKISWGIQRHKSLVLDQSLGRKLSERILLYYSGRSRNSGINNWTLFKDFLDKKNSIPQNFQSIVDATQELYQSLEKLDWPKMGQAIRKDWDLRKVLAADISTDEMNRAFEICQKFDSHSYNVCGAGGGGCFFIFFDDAEQTTALKKKKDVQSALQIEMPDLQVLAFQFANEGLKLQ